MNYHAPPKERYLCEACMEHLFLVSAPARHETAASTTFVFIQRCRRKVADFVYSYLPVACEFAMIPLQFFAQAAMCIYCISCWLFPVIGKPRTPEEEHQQRFWRKAEKARIDLDKILDELATIRRWLSQPGDPRETRELIEKEAHLEVLADDRRGEIAAYMEQYYAAEPRG